MSLKKPLKILYFNPCVHLGGVEVLLLNILGKLDRADVEPLVVTGGDGTFTAALDRAGIPHRRLRNILSTEAGFPRVLLQYLPNLIRIGRILDMERPDLIHDVTHDGLMYLSLAARQRKIPLLWQPQLPWDQVRRRGRIVQKLHARIKLDFIIFLNHYAKKSYASFSGTPWEIVPNSVDLKAFTERERRGLGRKYPFPENKRLVALAARVVPGKGHEEFIRAAGKVTRNEQDVLFLIIGETGLDPPFTGKLRRLVSELGLEKALRFTGFLYPPADFMRCLDVLALPSRSEMQGMVLLEAMACGVPVVGSDIEPIREMIKNEETGFLARPGDEESLARAVLILLRDGHLRDQIARNAMESVRRNHSLERNAARIFEIYRKLCSEERRRNSGP